MNRGMTLLETVLSLGLLAAITIALVSWLQAAASARARVTGPVRVERAVRAVLDRIEDDLVHEDHGTKSKHSAANAPGAEDSAIARVRVLADGSLEIVSRAGAGTGERTIVAYRLASGDRLERDERVVRAASAAGVDEPSERRNRRLLVGGVETWTCVLDPERRRLDVTVEVAQGPTLGRSYSVEPSP